MNMPAKQHECGAWTDQRPAPGCTSPYTHLVPWEPKTMTPTQKQPESELDRYIATPLAADHDLARAELVALRERVRLLDAIMRRCFRIDPEAGVVSIDCPTEDEFRTALQEPQP